MGKRHNSGGSYWANRRKLKNTEKVTEINISVTFSKHFVVFLPKKGYNRAQSKKRGRVLTMKVSREEIMHIAKLANLNLKEDEIDTYILHLQDILNFANIVNNAPVEGACETISANENYNVFRKDEIKVFDDNEALMSNAPEKERNMFKIPKVIQ